MNTTPESIGEALVTAPDYHNSWCDYCTSKAVYDAQTNRGYWAFVCEQHFQSETSMRLGLGLGQRLVPMSEIVES
jgi:hypothetical protein